MTTDIVERLRGTADSADEAGFTGAAEIAREAADEIERLRKEQRHTHAHMNHLRAELSRLRNVVDAARTVVEECDSARAPSLGSLAKLEDTIHAAWKET